MLYQQLDDKIGLLRISIEEIADRVEGYDEHDLLKKIADRGPAYVLKFNPVHNLNLYARRYRLNRRTRAKFARLNINYLIVLVEELIDTLDEDEYSALVLHEHHHITSGSVDRKFYSSLSKRAIIHYEKKCDAFASDQLDKHIVKSMIIKLIESQASFLENIGHMDRGIGNSKQQAEKIKSRRDIKARLHALR